jgi:hypothetical protein
MSSWAAIALAAPGCLLAAASVIALALASIDRHPMWPREPMNIAEAAAVRDEAEVIRLVESGENFNDRYPVRPGLLFAPPTQLTPLEAGIASDDPMVVQWLLQQGAPLDIERWTYLRCIAGGDEVPPLLERHRPPGAEANCDSVRSPWPQDD